LTVGVLVVTPPIAGLLNTPAVKQGLITRRIRPHTMRQPRPKGWGLTILSNGNALKYMYREESW